MKVFLSFFSLFFLISNASFADTIGLRISGGVFDYEVSGTIRDSAVPTDEVNVKDDLNWADDSDTQFVAYFEHPVPLIPNVRVGSTSANPGGSGVVTASFTYNGQTITASETVTSDIDLSHTEIGLYYEILDNVVELDLGLNVKFFDGDLNMVASGGATIAEAFDATVPMLYAAAAVNLPLTGLSLRGDISAIGAGDAEFTDYFIRLSYTSSFLLGAEIGYRHMNLSYEDSGQNEYADLTLEGPYAHLMIAF